MKVIKSLVLTAFLSVATIGVAHTPSDSSLEKLANIIHFNENFNKGMQTGFMNSFEVSFKSNPDFQQLSPKQQKELYQLAEKYANKILTEVNTAEFRKAMLVEFNKSAKRFLTQEEVNAMIDFYGSPVGQKIVVNQNAMMADFMSNFSQMLLNPNSSLNQQVTKVSEKYGKEAEKEVEKLLNK